MDISSYLLGKKAGGGSDVKVQSNKDATITSNTTTEISPDTGYDALGKVSVTTNVQPTLQNKTVSVSSNGEQTVTKDSGYDGLDTVTIDTNVQPDLESKSVTITSNGETTVSPTSGKDGLSDVTVTTNVQPNLESKSVEITTNTTTTITPTTGKDGLSSVEVVTNVSGGGVRQNPDDDVIFYDYDGTIVASYTKADFLALSSMPSNPSHTGLTAQGWNWTLADAKTHVQKYDQLDIGQSYITSDGKTRIYIKLYGGALKPYLQFTMPTGTATINWGDGNTETVSGSGSSYTPTSLRHTYSQAGDYVITLSSDNLITFKGGTSQETSTVIFNNQSGSSTYDIIYTSTVQKLELGNNIALDNCCFGRCYELKTVTIPNTINSLGQKVFAHTGLKYATIPNNITTLPQSIFKECFYFERVSLPKITTLSGGAFNTTRLNRITLPDGLTNYGNTFMKCNALKKIVIPASVTNGTGTITESCTNVEEIVWNEGITALGGNYSTQNIKRVTLPSTITTWYQSMFQNCPFLEEVVFAEGCTTCGSYFIYNDVALRKVVFPSTFTTLPQECFKSCEALASIVMPRSLSSIGKNCFTNCSSLKYIDFSDHQAVPTLGGDIGGQNIIVPDALYEDWIVAENWSNVASKIIKKSDWDAQ